MAASSLAQLEQEIRRQMMRAMRESARRMEVDLYDETGKFYAGGNPKVYTRTGALANTPEVTSVSGGGNSVEFTARLNTSGGYTTGAHPSMSAVLKLANDGDASGFPGGKARPTVGKKHFWDRAEDKMENTFHSTMGSFFK